MVVAAAVWAVELAGALVLELPTVTTTVGLDCRPRLVAMPPPPQARGQPGQRQGGKQGRAKAHEWVAAVFHGDGVPL